MKMTLIGNATSGSSRRLQEEANKEGIGFIAVNIDALVVSIQKNTFSLFSEENTNLSDSDCYLFRGVGDATQEVMVIAQYLQRQGATIIEEIAAHGALQMDKLRFGTLSKDILTPDYMVIQSTHALDMVRSTLEYPLVVKSNVGSLGKGICLAQNESELKDVYAELGPRVILQQYLPVDHDYRALVIGGTYIGAYSRERSDGNVAMNAPGNTKEAAALPEEVKRLCQRAAREHGVEVAGIDLLQWKDKWYVLEVNTSPGFTQFEDKTEINVAKRIIEYAKEKTEKNASFLRP